MSRNSQLLERIERAQVLTPLGMPTPNRAPFSSLVKKESAPREEIIRLVRRLFLQRNQPAGPAVVSFCGLAKGDGSSWICARAAEYLASKADASVCLVDADFHSPQLHAHFGVENGAGFAAALAGKAPLRQFVASVASTNLWLIPSGSIKLGFRVEERSLSLRFAELRNEFDYVFVSAPPLSRRAQAIQLARLTDGVVLMRHAGWISRQVVNRTRQGLKSADIRILESLEDTGEFSLPQYLHQRIEALEFPRLRNMRRAAARNRSFKRR